MNKTLDLSIFSEMAQFRFSFSGIAFSSKHLTEMNFAALLYLSKIARKRSVKLFVEYFSRENTKEKMRPYRFPHRFWI